MSFELPGNKSRLFEMIAKGTEPSYSLQMQANTVSLEGSSLSSAASELQELDAKDRFLFCCDLLVCEDEDCFGTDSSSFAGDLLQGAESDVPILAAWLQPYPLSCYSETNITFKTLLRLESSSNLYFSTNEPLWRVSRACL